MVKKVSSRRMMKKPAKKITLKKLEIIINKNKIRKYQPKNNKIQPQEKLFPKKSVKKAKNEINSDLISQSFFDAQSFIKLQCCFCSKNLNNIIKVILEPFPKVGDKALNFIKKNFLPFEVSCLKCFMMKLKQSNFKSIESINYYYNDDEPHLYNNYHIINKMSEPIFTEDWSFGQEIKLLGALSHLGIGNWEEISNILGKGKFECESHYYSFYYKNNKDYLPNINNNINLKNKNEMKKNKDKENSILKNIGNEIGYIPYNIDNNQSNRSININRNNTKSEHNNTIIMQNAYNTLGYWPKRKEFDVEYKNDAEIELMEIDYKEIPNTINNKENLYSLYDKILSHYNIILDKREERKNFVLDKNLYDVKKQIMNEKKLTKEDREIYQSMKQCLKYLKNEEFKDYFEGIILEKNLKSRLNQLLYYYKMGYKTYGQIYKYIYDLKLKNNKIRNKYTIKSTLKNLNISLRESTVKQVNKFNETIDNNE